MVDSVDKVMEKAAERKAKRKAGRTKDTCGTASSGAPMPVMTKAEQTRKLHEMKARFLNSKRLEPLVTKMFDIAMDDEHQGQMSAIKLIADRILPATGFTNDSNKSSAVQINITGLQVQSVDEKPVNQDDTPVSIQ